MPIAKLITEAAGTITEEVAKRGKRTEFKQLKEIPEEVKTLDPIQRDIEAANILDADKSQEFIDVRQKDISLDKTANYLEGQKQSAKVLDQQAKIDAAQAKVDAAPKILDAETNRQLQINKASVDAQAEKMQALQDRQRDLYLKSLNLKKEGELTKQIEGAKQSGVSAYNSIENILAQSPGEGRVFSNIEGRTTAIYNKISSGMYDLKEGLRTKAIGLSQNVELADEVIRFMKDGKVRNQNLLSEVKKIADQWTSAAESIKNLRNKAGARVGKLEDWILPQSHDARKIRVAGYDKWKKSIMPKLDRARIEAEQGAPLENVLESAYKNITAPKVESTGKGGTSVVAKKGEESRVLHFNTGEDIIAYKNEFGNPDIFATMDNHIRQQSNEIAMMQIMGSNPGNTFEKLKELARADGMGTVRESDLDRLWKVASGQVDGDNIVDKADAVIAAIGGGHRAIAVSSKLGTALVSSLADLGNIVIGAGYRNLNSIKIMGRGLQTLLQEATTFGKVGYNIELANRIGVVSEFASASLANSRFAETIGQGFLQKASEGVIRASGLASYTTSLRASFGLEMAANLAENFSKNLDDVPFSNMLKEYGIDGASWDVIRSTQARDIKGSKFIDLNKVYEVDEELGFRVSEMITNEMNSFVVAPGDRVRKWTTAGAKKGTVLGETARNILLFKSFPISVTMMHINRINKINSKTGKVAYIGAAIAANTVMGGITLWAYDIVTGKTARSIDRPAFVFESIAKSGGLGIFGDFFIGLSDTGYGNSMTSTLIGVPASTIEDIAKTAQDVFTKDADKAVGNIYKRAKNYIPGQNLWYTRMAIERTIGDSIGELVDPDHQKKLRRRKKAMRLRGQEELF